MTMSAGDGPQDDRVEREARERLIRAKARGWLMESASQLDISVVRAEDGTWAVKLMGPTILVRAFERAIVDDEHAEREIDGYQAATKFREIPSLAESIACELGSFPQWAPEIVPAAAAFGRNASRLSALCVMPHHIQAEASFRSHLELLARIKERGSPFVNDPGVASVPLTETELNASIEELYRELEGPSPTIWIETVGATGDVVSHNEAAVFNVEARLARSKILRDATRSLFEMVLVQAWTCFETLAEDLWMAAFAAWPDPLASNAAGAQALRQKGGRNSQVQANQHGHRSGRATARMPTYKFRQFDGIRLAYEEAFRVPSINALFSGPEGNALATLAQLRHLIVHKAGIVDEGFLRNLKGLSGDFAQSKLHVAVELDGATVKRYALAGIRSAKSLFEEVRAWASQRKSP